VDDRGSEPTRVGLRGRDGTRSDTYQASEVPYRDAMTDEVEPWQMSPAAQDKAVEVGYNVIELALSMFPFIGGPASGGMAMLRAHRAQERLERILGELRQEVAMAVRQRAHESSRLDEVLSIVDSNGERFIPLVQRVLSESLETSDEAKLRRMRHGLGSLVGQLITDERDLFLRLVCRYDVLEVFILQILAQHSYGTPQRVSNAPQLIWDSVQAEFRDDFYETQIPSMTHTLEADGLLIRDQEGLISSDPVRPGLYPVNPNPTLVLTITDRGLRFLEYLAEGDVRHARAASQ
jgi:hypothetical protein